MSAQFNSYETGHVDAGHTTFEQREKPQCPDTYLLWAILTTFLCCTPISIYAIVKAAQVEKFYYSGHYEAALSSSKSAKRWSIISAVVFVVGTILSVVLFFVLCAIADIDLSELQQSL